MTEFNPYELEPAWRDYPCEWKRPRFAHIPHEVDWMKLYALRKQRRQSERAAINNGACQARAADTNHHDARADGLPVFKSDPGTTFDGVSAPRDAGEK
jgi:hypothetical protein